MNRILNEIKEIIKQNINEYLPEIKSSDLEENGTVYYMNGKNGTEFDWYVNEHLPSFMVFYNDEQNLGVAKLLIYANGEVILYIYGDKGNKVIKEVKTSIEVAENELFNLAVILKSEADDKSIWEARVFFHLPALAGAAGAGRVLHPAGRFDHPRRPARSRFLQLGKHGRVKQKTKNAKIVFPMEK